MKLYRWLLAMLAGVMSMGASAAKVDTVMVAGRHLDEPMRVIVITPDTRQQCPSLYLLNGYGGDCTSWLTIRPDLPRLADQYGMLMVLPSGMDSWYWDSPLPEGRQMESFFVNDLVPWVEANYPAIPSRDKRAITGLSMGGHGALWLAINHPDLWASAGSTSGGVNIIPFAGRWKMHEALGPYEGNEARWEHSTVINQVPRLSPGIINIIFDCGSDDFFAGVNADLHAKLLEAGIPHDYISRPGNHSSKYWANSILYQLVYFNEIFKR